VVNDEQVRGAEVRHDTLVGYRADEIHTSPQRRRTGDAHPHVRQQFVRAVDHRQRGIGQPREGALESIEHGHGILVRVQAADPQNRGRSAHAGRFPRRGARDRPQRRAGLHDLIRWVRRRNDARPPPRIRMLGGGEEECICRTAAGAAEQSQPRRAADRAVRRMVLHHDRGRRRHRAAHQPGLHRKNQTVDVHDVRPDRRDRPGQPQTAGAGEDVIDAVFGDSRAAVKPLHDGHAAGPRGGERLAPAGQGEIALEQGVGFGQPAVEAIVNLSDGESAPDSFHLKRRPIDIYCAGSHLLRHR